MCDVLFRGGGKIKPDDFFFARKAVDEPWLENCVSTLTTMVAAESIYGESNCLVAAIVGIN